MPLPKEIQRYTYSDYYLWDDDERWELIDGEAYAMAPAPNMGHQGISGEIHRQIANFLRGKTCRVFHAPFDVRLNADTYDDTVVQPDLVIVCDRSKLDIRGCKGVPDMVIEILSPSSARHDRVLKFHTYQRAGVREYWLVDPESRTVSVHILENGKYVTTAYTDDDTAPVHVLEGCEITLRDVFGAII
jgi:Uma2 family endonuclease